MDTTVFTTMAMVILMARLKKPTIRVIGAHPTPSSYTPALCLIEGGVYLNGILNSIVTWIQTVLGLWGCF